MSITTADALSDPLVLPLSSVARAHAVKPIPMPQQLKKKLGRTDLAMGYTWFDPREEGDEGAVPLARAWLVTGD
jgi:hypothetical protein